jgi:hypothetical protein
MIALKLTKQSVNLYAPTQGLYRVQRPNLPTISCVVLMEQVKIHKLIVYVHCHVGILNEL